MFILSPSRRTRMPSRSSADFGQIPGIWNGARQQLFVVDVEFVKSRLRRDEAAASEQLSQFDETQRACMRWIGQQLDAMKCRCLSGILRCIASITTIRPPGMQTRTISRNTAAGSSR